MTNNKKYKMLATIGIIAFLTYNALLFLIFGFEDHTAVFWLSWAFMLVAFLCIALVSSRLSKNGRFLCDWLFGYPIIKHGVIYIIAEFILSTVFIILDDWMEWTWALIPQLLLLAIYLIFTISGFLSKETINDVNTRVSDKTRFVKLLRADSELLAQKCDDPALKEQCRRFAEAVRYSDPMSHEALFELEKELALAVSDCDKAIDEKNYAEADALCKKALSLLDERNKKCKALK